MKFIIIIIILFISFFSPITNQEYQLLIHQFFAGEIILDINIFNKGVDFKNDNDNLYYYGSIENIEKIDLFDEKKMNYPLVFIFDSDYIRYINLFPETTTFVIFKRFILNEEDYQNYTILSLNNYYRNSFFLEDLSQNSFYYIQIGKKIDESIEKILHILIVLSIFICFILFFIMIKILNRNNRPYQLALQYLICISTCLLTVANAINGFFFIFFKNREFCFIMEYTTLLIYSFYKSNLYSIILLVLLGWGTIYFGWKRKFNSLNKKLFLFDLVLSILIPISVYFIKITNKLNLFYIKNFLEYFGILCFIIYSILNRIIPLSKQINYEIRTHSNLIECFKIKYNKLFLLNIIIITYTIFFMFTPLLDYKFIYSFCNNYNIHFIFQLFYESFFMIFFFLVFFGEKLPENYFNEVIFKYKIQVCLSANIYEKNNYNPSINDISEINYTSTSKLSIYNLSLYKLKKISKTKKNLVVFINPFASSQSKTLFKQIHLGLVEKNKKIK